ncbi:hypothetical protein ACFLRI_02725 [Bacteroidota bacterium]
MRKGVKDLDMNIRQQSYYHLLLIFILIAPVVNAQVSLKAHVDSTHILIGDWFKMTVEVRHKPDIRIMGSEFIDSIHSIDIIKSSEVDSSISKDFIIEKQEFTLTSFQPGLQQIPEFRVYYQNPDDTNLRWISSDTFQIMVDAMEADTSQAIMPIKPPLRVPLHWKDLRFLIFVYPLLLLISLIVLYVERKRKNKPFLPVRQKPKLPAHLIAIRDLRMLEEEKLWQKGEDKEFHVRLTDIVRQYIEDRYQLPALESTTDEIEDILKHIDIPSNNALELVESLKQSDLVKFAKMSLMPDDNQKCLKIAYSFVNSTKEKLTEQTKKEMFN